MYIVIKVWKLFDAYKGKNVAPTKDSDFVKNLMIKEITARLNALTMNTVVSGFMEYTNKMIDITKAQNGIDKSCLETLIVLLSPFVPHIAEELGKKLDTQKLCLREAWPDYDESKLVVDEITIPLQVNGKARENLVISRDASKEEILEKAKEMLASRLKEKTIVKEIYVPGKIVNIVVK